MTYDEALAVFNFCSHRLKDKEAENDWLDQLQKWTGIDPKTVAALTPKLRDDIKREFRFHIWGCLPDGKGPCNKNRRTPSANGIAAVKRFALNKIQRYREAGEDVYTSPEFNYPYQEHIPG